MNSSSHGEQTWSTVVSANDKGCLGTVGEVIKYRDLIAVLVKKDFSHAFRQTLLGPLWIVLNPIVSTLMFALALGYFARIQTDGIPIILFYLTGGIVWAYFSNAFTNMSQVLNANNFILAKVYVPRIVLPIACGLTALLKFLSVLLVCIPVYAYYAAVGKAAPNLWLLAFPGLLVLLFLLSLGMGLALASLTIRRRDLSVLAPFSMSILMFLSPVLYPASAVPARFQTLYDINPLTGIMECFRYGVTGAGRFDPSMLASAVLATLGFLSVGLFLFGKVSAEIPDYI